MSNPSFSPLPQNQQRTCTYELEGGAICGKEFIAQSKEQKVCPNHSCAQGWKTALERRKGKR